MESIKIKGVRVDEVTMKQALEQVLGWLKQSQKKTVFTPNFEFIIAAAQDSDFKKVLNSGDLNLPDSSHLGWMDQQLKLAGVRKMFNWFTFLQKTSFPVVPGVDFLEKLCHEAAEKGYSVGLLGSQPGVGEKAASKLKAKYPGLRISFVGGSDWQVDKSGQLSHNSQLTSHISPCDILFVAFGHGKQEKWIANYKSKTQAKVFMGVGGALDYISGEVPRAPKSWQNLGLEWLYRLLHQPSRITRQFEIIKFLLGLL